MTHRRDIEHYEGELDELSRNVGRLTYDQVAAFLGYLAEELASQSEADAGRGRPRLSHEVSEATQLLYAVLPHIHEAWRISAPHMTPEERGEARADTDE